MFGQRSEFERTWAAMDQIRRRMEQAFDGDAQPAGWPRVDLWDAGSELRLRADVPGLGEKDIQVQLEKDVLTLSGARAAEAPEGYRVHRQERTPVRFSRSFPLPCKVNADAITASLSDGVLTVTLPKAPESQPRQIPVKAG